MSCKRNTGISKLSYSFAILKTFSGCEDAPYRVDDLTLRKLQFKYKITITIVTITSNYKAQRGFCVTPAPYGYYTVCLIKQPPLAGDRGESKMSKSKSCLQEYGVTLGCKWNWCEVNQLCRTAAQTHCLLPIVFSVRLTRKTVLYPSALPGMNPVCDTVNDSLIVNVSVAQGSSGSGKRICFLFPRNNITFAYELGLVFQRTPIEDNGVEQQYWGSGEQTFIDRSLESR